MPTQFRYQASERVTGPTFAIAEDWARIDLNLDGQFEIILPATRQRQAGDIEIPARAYRYDPATGLVPVTMRDSAGGVLTTSWVQDMIVGDFNGDGRADLLIGDHGGEQPAPVGHVGGRLQLWLASAAGPVVSVVSEPLGPRGFWHATGAADFNRDGSLDIVSVSGEFIEAIKGIAIFTNDGQGRFTLNTTALAPTTANMAITRNALTSTVTAADLDRDGRADLVWGPTIDTFNTPPTAREVRVYFGQATGLTNDFVALPFADLTAQGLNPLLTSADKLKVADFNGDGLLDVSVILTNNAVVGRWAQIFLQGPNRTFTELKLWPDNIPPKNGNGLWSGDGIVAVDVNNDGLPDIHFQNNAASSFTDLGLATYINMGDGSYRTLAAVAPNLWAEPTLTVSWHRWGDLDGDGQVELIGTRFVSGNATSNTTEFFSSRLTIDALQATGGPLTGTIFGETITGTAGADTLDGWLGADTINAGAGDDLITGGTGGDRIDGGAGNDTAVYSGRKADYTVASGVAGWTVVDNRAGSPDGADTLVAVEFLQFADGKAPIAVSTPPVALPAAVATAMSNILRAEPLGTTTAELATSIASRMAAGTLSQAQAIAELVKAADASTSVATMSYQFFTGKIPGAGGIDYLVSPTGPNATNLNSAYFQTFNIENRYINFAVNLGKNGEGKAAFEAAYGARSLLDTVKAAYQTIFGSAPTDAKAHLLLDPRAEYFASYGQDGPNGLGTKAAVVGWLLAEAAKADLGTYSRANDAFLTDLADGATFAVDLVAVYGRPEFAFIG